MKSYHITQEQAEALWDKVSLSLSKGQSMQQAYANAVLDKVLGEHVAGEVESIRRACRDNNYVWPKELSSGVMFYEGHRITIEQFNEQAKLYAPKELP